MDWKRLAQRLSIGWRNVYNPPHLDDGVGLESGDKLPCPELLQALNRNRACLRWQHLLPQSLQAAQPRIAAIKTNRHSVTITAKSDKGSFDFLNIDRSCATELHRIIQTPSVIEVDSWHSHTKPRKLEVDLAFCIQARVIARAQEAVETVPGEVLWTSLHKRRHCIHQVIRGHKKWEGGRDRKSVV